MRSRFKQCKSCVSLKVNDNTRLKYKDVLNRFKENGYTLLEDSYVNSKTKMKFICPNGHQSSINWDHFNKGQRCRACAIIQNANNQKLKLDDIRFELDTKNFKLLDLEYIDIHSPLNLICSCGNNIVKSFATFKASPKCTCEILEKMNLRINKKRYTEKELIDAFWQFHTENKRYPSMDDFKLNPKYPSASAYSKRWNGWSNFLKEIGVLGSNGWYVHDEKVLAELYTTNDKQLILDSLLVGRSWNSVVRKARIMGLNKVNILTNDDILNQIREFVSTNKRYPTGEDFSLDNNSLPSFGKIRSHFGNLGNVITLAGFSFKKKIKLSDEQLSLIFNDYSSGMPIVDIGDRHNISEMRVLDEVKKAGIPARNKRWTKEKINILKEVYPTEPWEDVIIKLHPFEKEAIHMKASSLNISRECYGYSEVQEKYLVENYEKYTVNELSKILGKTKGSIASKVGKLNLVKVEKWSDEEINIIKERFPYQSTESLLVFLPKRNKNTINEMASKLGVLKDKVTLKNEHTVKVKKSLIENLISLSNKLGKTPTTNDLGKYLNGASTYHRYFGSYSNACQEANLPVNANLFGRSFYLHSINGDVCLSKKEKEITDVFIKNNITFSKEVLYKDILKDEGIGNIRCDWVIGDIVIEYFGMADRKDYRVRMESKINLCEEKQIKLIPLYEKDISSNFAGMIKKFKAYGINLTI